MASVCPCGSVFPKFCYERFEDGPFVSNVFFSAGRGLFVLVLDIEINIISIR